MKRLFSIFAILLSATLVNGAEMQCRDVFSAQLKFDRNAWLTGPTSDEVKANLENLSIEVMRQISSKRDNRLDNVGGWVDSLSDNQDTLPLNVLEHTALLFIYKSGVLDSSESPELSESLKHAIQKSFTHLTGKDTANEDYLSPLPARVLRDPVQSSDLAVLFHDSVFDDAIRDGQLNQTGSAANRLRTIVRKAATRVTWSRFFQTILTAAALTTSPGRAIFAGGLLGLVEASANEYLIHIGIGHATPRFKRFLRHLGRAGEFALDVTFAHSVHHTLVRSGFAVADLTPEMRAKAEQIMGVAARAHLVERMIYEKYPDLSSEDYLNQKEALTNEVTSDPEFDARLDLLKVNLRKGNYGVNGTWKGAASMLVTATPYYLLNLSLFAVTGNVFFLASSTISMTTMILQSLYSHWYLHLAPEKRDTVKTNFFQRSYLDTDIGKLALRLHYTHHQVPMRPTQNGVIMAGSAWDRITDTLTPSRTADLIKMYIEGWIP